MKRGFRGAPRPLLPAMLLVATNPNAGQEHDAVAQSQPSSSTPPVPSTSSPPVQSPPPIPATIPTLIFYCYLLFAKYALTSNPTIYDSLVKQFWQTATANTKADGTLEINATIDTIGYTITEASIRDTLQLADATGITMLPNDEIFEGMGQMGSKSGGWDQFGSNIATALICLSTDRVYNFSKLIFDGMVANLKSEEHHDVPQSQPSSSTPPVPSTSSPPVQSPTNPASNTIHLHLYLKLNPEPFEHTFEDPSPIPHTLTLQEQAQGQLPNSEEEEPEAQGRKSQDDPSNSLYKTVTPSTTNRKEGSLKNWFFREVDTGAKEVNTAEGVNTGSIKLSTVSEQVSTGSTKMSIPSPDKGQREGKAPMISEETPKKSKEQILQEEASLAEAIRLDSLQKEEEAKQIHLDSLLAQRIAEEEELNEQQKKRKAQVQFEAQHYTDEDWDLIRAKIEANAELSKSMLGSDLQGEDFAKKMVDLVNQRKKYFAEERARAKRNKPMTQSQLKTYMMNYLKNQGTWKLSQLKNLSFEEVKEEFDKLVKQVELFAPMNFEATKASLKRFGEELQTKTSKRLKSDEAKDDEPTKKSGKRRKQMARKGLHTYINKGDYEDSDEVSEQDDSVSGTKIPINPVPVAMKSPSIATYKIIKQGEKGVYQIVREDGTDIVYINFGAMLKDISRDDLTELYRIVMNRYGMDGPEDELEKVFWKYLKNMFEEPLSTDPIWSALGQERIISWRYYDTCRVHCLNLESMDIYMLIERQYPLSAEICKAMLDKKLQGGKPDENCYKMLKMMEKQAGIRK
ncbi:hypothetical protein Tco_0466150 [Tanacetum coccineum]